MSRLVHRVFNRFFPARRPAPAARGAAHFRTRLFLQALEGRVVPATFTVLNTADAGAGSLRQALLDANANIDADTVVFNTNPANGTNFSTAQTITLSTGELVIANPVTVTGPGAALLTVTGNNASRVFAINKDMEVIPVTLSGMRITGGNSTTAGVDGGGVFTGDENVTILNSVITGNAVSGATNSSGGGIAVAAGGSLTLRNSTVSGNTTSGRGGGIYFFNAGSLVVENSSISGNTAAASEGGGIYFYGYVSPGGLSIRNTTISGNTAVTGGGIALRNLFGEAQVQNSTITNNTATSTSATAGLAGGGIAKISGAGTVTLVSSIVSGNTAPGAPAGRADISANTVSRLVTATASAIGVDPGSDVLSIFSRNNLPFGANLDLQPLAANGTHPLGPNSLAANKGVSPAGVTTDQVGGNRSQGGVPDIGAFESALTTPTGAAAPADVTAAAPTFQFQVTYAAAAGINPGTLGTGDIRVTGPGGFSPVATFVGVSDAAPGSPRVATYSITPPGGGWDPADFGTYTIAVEANQVADAGGAFVPAAAVGTFRAVVPTTFTVTTTADAGAGSLRQAILDANADPTPSLITFGPLFATAQTITLTSDQLLIADTLTIAGPAANLLTVRRDSAAATQFRIFEVNGPGVISATFTGMTISGGQTGTNTGSGSGTANDGAAIVTFNDPVTVDRVTISGNSSGSEGGAIAVASATNAAGGAAFVTVRNSTISGNTAAGALPAGSFGGGGGGIYFANGGSLLVENSTISGNTSTNSRGGGVYFYGMAHGGGVTVRNSTISGNTAGNRGGGLEIGYLSGTFRIDNSTIVNNNGTATGGGIAVVGDAGTVALASTVVANNTATAGPDVSGRVTANTSLIRDQAGATITGTGNLAAGTNPMLGTLGPNGGPVQTHLPLAGSPLLNVGANPATLLTDARGPGFARQVGAGVDIGAVEVQAATPVTVASVVVNDGAAQRSVVTSVTVTFSGSVGFSGAVAAAFRLARTAGGAAGDVGLVAEDRSTPTQTIIRLTFTGPLTQGLAASLADGVYQLTIASAQVSGAGVALDGNADGTAGGDYVTPADVPGQGAIRLFRRFGDSDGDADVDLSDLIRFGTAYQIPAGYNLAFDSDGDGDVDLTDLIQFGLRYQVAFP